MTGGCVEQYVACIVYGRWWGKCGIDINLKWINFPAARRKEILQDNLIKKISKIKLTSIEVLL